MPWVEKLDHLGHIFQQNLSMEADASRARASFMNRASDLRDQLYFANPEQRMQAIQLYCCDAYGSMLWEQKTRYTDSFYRAWNVQARLAWRIPRETHVNLLETYFCQDFQSMKKQVLSRYHKFMTKLSQSPSKEVRFLYFLIHNDCRSVTGRNLKYLNELCKCNTLKFANWKIKQMLPEESNCEPWRARLLATLLEARNMKSYHSLNLNRTQTDEMIESLCTS